MPGKKRVWSRELKISAVKRMLAGENTTALAGQFLENVYNRQRLHSALGYRPPAEFEASQPVWRHRGANLETTCP